MGEHARRLVEVDPALLDQGSAVERWRRNLDADPTDQSAIRNLQTLYARECQWEELAKVLELRAACQVDNPAAYMETLLRIASLWDVKLGDGERAIRAYERVIAIAPHNKAAVARLEHLYRAQREWAKLVELLIDRVPWIEEKDAKRELFREAARIYEYRLCDQEAAFVVLHAAFRENQPDEVIRGDLERLATEAGTWTDLLPDYEKMARRLEASDPSGAADLWVEIGEHYDVEVANLDRAGRAFEQALRLDPEHCQALAVVAELHRKRGTWPELVRVLQRRAALATESEAKVGFLLERCSVLAKHMGDNEGALETYRAALAIDPTNAAVIEALDDIYRRAENLVPLIDIYHDVGRTCETELGDDERAIHAFGRILEYEAEEPRALAALGRIHERREEWNRAIAMMKRLSRTELVERERVELYHRMGAIHATHLEDSEQAESYFVKALAFDELHAESQDALVQLYRDQEDWNRVAETLLRAAENCQKQTRRIHLLRDAAQVYRTQLGSPKARALYEQVVALDPDDRESADVLVDYYYGEKNWEKLHPLLEHRVEQEDGFDADDSIVAKLRFRAARCAVELGKRERARSHYEAAADLEPTHLPTLLERAGLLRELREWDGALECYHNILKRCEDSLTLKQRTDVYRNLGEIHQHCKETDYALAMFEEALSVSPHDGVVLRHLVDLHTSTQNWRAVIRRKRALMRNEDADGRARLGSEIAVVYHKHLGEPQEAAKELTEATRLFPKDHRILQQLLDLHTDTKQWREALEVIERFAEIETNRIRRGRYFHAAATICREELKDVEGALDYFERALDAYFAGGAGVPKEEVYRCLQAFADIDAMLTARRDWRAQERAYQRMINRLPEGSELLPDLMHGLGEIYRSRLHRVDEAIPAFEIAAHLSPGNRQRSEILAELYLQAGTNQLDKAIAQHRKMLEEKPTKLDSLRALRSIYMDTHQFDRAWCVSAVLVAIDSADESERQFFQQYSGRGVPKATHAMSKDLWAAITHPQQDGRVTAALQTVTTPAALLRAEPHRCFELKRKNRRNVVKDDLQFSRIFSHACRVLAIDAPDLYLQPEQMGELLLANTCDKDQLCPSLVARSGLLQGRSGRAVAFVTGRTLAYLRPGNYLALALPTLTEIRAAIVSVIAAAEPAVKLSGTDKSLVDKYLPALRAKMSHAAEKELGKLSDRTLMPEQDADVRTWVDAVHLTAQRVGLLLCGDLATAVRIVAGERAGRGGIKPRDMIEHLLRFAVSDEYFVARERLGITVLGPDDRQGKAT